MSNFNSDGPYEGEWEDRGDLAWNEFDWERYLREQDEAIQRYAAFYDNFRGSPQRIDDAARSMGWDSADWSNEDMNAEDEDLSEDDDDFEDNPEVYTLHKNPIFIATKAICQGLRQKWLLVASAPENIPTSMGLRFLLAVQQAEEQSIQAIHALDFGDYAMAISLLKRAQSTLNTPFGLLGDETLLGQHPALVDFRAEALPRLFDLREIWLRVINECRAELKRPAEGDF